MTRFLTFVRNDNELQLECKSLLNFRGNLIFFLKLEQLYETITDFPRKRPTRKLLTNRFF